MKLILLGAFVLTLIPLHANALELEKNVFYVSSNGDDSNDGTLDAPWRTIQRAADKMEAGDTVYVREGKYSEFVHITVSGSQEDGYISFKAFPGEAPVLDGSNLTLEDGNRALFYLENASYITVKGFEIRNLSTNDSNKYPAGILVSEGGSDIQLVDNNIHHIKNESKKGNAHGILFYGNSTNTMSRIKVQNNEIHHLILGSSESLTLSGNIDGFIISDNSIHHNNNIGIDVAGFYGACQSNCRDQVRNGKIANNQVYNNSSGNNPAYKGSNSAAGIYADGSTDIVIENNLVYNNDFGIELASENNGKQTSYITAKNNIIYNNNGAGIIIGGANQSNGGAYKNVISNNILNFNDQLGEGYGDITVQWNVEENQFLNNIIYSKNPKNNIQLNDKKEKSNLFLNNRIYTFIMQPSLANRITTKIKDLMIAKD